MCAKVEHAYALVTVKSVDRPARRLSGIATTPELDRQGDIFEPLGASFKNPLPLLLHHNPREVVGTARLDPPTPVGITFTADIPEVKTAGALQQRTDTAWQELDAGLVWGVSIGFDATEVKRLESGGRHFLKSEILELSLTSIPANRTASVHTVKALLERRTMTTAEQIATLESKRTLPAARMIALAAEADGAVFTKEQAAEYDRLDTEVKAMDEHLARVKRLEEVQRGQAKSVLTVAGPTPYQHVSITPNIMKGAAFVRYVCARALHPGSNTDAAAYAARWNDSTPEVALMLKAAVAAGNTTDTAWAGPLVQPVTGGFLELLRAATIVDRIPGLRRAPFNAKIAQQTTASTVAWVGEAKSKPVSALGFGTVTLAVTKVAGIVVITEELAKLSTPSAEQIVRDDMVAVIARYIDTSFINPALSAVAGVSPASVTFGAPTAAATTNPLADMMGLINHFTTNNIPVEGLTFIMSPANLLAMSFKTYSDGSPTFPGIGVNGGSWKGMTFISSNTAGTNVIALQPGYILLADEGGVTVDVSREASLQMDSAPVDPPAATTIMESLWQTNRIGIRAERFINWTRVGVNTVKYLTAAAYPAPAGVEAPAP